MFDIKPITMKQYPLRMEASLFHRLDAAANATGIPKATILRMGAIKVLNELDASGVTTIIGKIK